MTKTVTPRPAPLPDHYVVYRTWEDGTITIDENRLATEAEATEMVDQLDGAIERIIHVMPAAEICTDVTERILEKLADATFDEGEIPHECIRDLFDRWELSYYQGEDEDRPRRRSMYAEHNTLNRAQQL